MITAFRPAYLPLSTRTTLPDFIIFPILYRMYQLSVNKIIYKYYRCSQTAGKGPM